MRDRLAVVNSFRAFRPLLAASFSLAALLTTPRAQDVTAHDVLWRTPSRDASGSMPIGNGEVGCNVWCEPDGRLCFYVARTDSWSEASRLLKLGKVTVQVRRPVAEEPFVQRLDLRNGTIEVTWGEGERRVTVSARRIVFTSSWNRQASSFLGAPSLREGGESLPSGSSWSLLALWPPPGCSGIPWWLGGPVSAPTRRPEGVPCGIAGGGRVSATARCHGVIPSNSGEDRPTVSCAGISSCPVSSRGYASRVRSFRTARDGQTDEGDHGKVPPPHG